MTDHDRLEELLAAYALDSVEGAEAPGVTRELVDHLASCATCPRLFEALRQTASDLAWAAPAAALSPGLFDRIMEATAPRRASAGEPPSTRGLLRQSRLAQGLVAASISVALGLGGLSAALSRDLGEARGERRANEAALAFVNHPATTTTAMSSTPGVGRMTLALRQDGRAMLIGSELRLAQDRIFEVWRRQGAELIPVATFTPEDGRALLNLRVEPGRDAGLAVTVERERVEYPTTEPVFEASLPA